MPATQSVEFGASAGQTVTAKLFSAGSDTVVQTASAVTAATNRTGVYTATFTDVAAGTYRLIATNAGGTLLAQWWVDLTLTTATFQAYEMPMSAVQTTTTNNDKTGYSLTAGTGLGNQTANITGNLSGSVGSVSGSVGAISGVTFPTNFGVLGINASGHVSRVVLVDTTTANTDMRGTDNAALASAWTATRAGYLDSVLLAQNSNQRTVQVTGSNHVASDVHAFQPDVIDSAAIAASAVTELQSGLATAANLLIVSDRVSYSLAVLVGACSDAQTAAETYTLSIGGNTFTVDYSGLDSSGNRSTTTLSKV